MHALRQTSNAHADTANSIDQAGRHQKQQRRPWGCLFREYPWLLCLHGKQEDNRNMLGRPLKKATPTSIGRRSAEEHQSKGMWLGNAWTNRLKHPPPLSHLRTHQVTTYPGGYNMCSQDNVAAKVFLWLLQGSPSLPPFSSPNYHVSC